MTADRERILDALEAIKNIEGYVVRGRPTFDDSELVQVWVVHHLQIIGEALGRVSQTLRSRTPEIPWSQITAMRNILVHEYARIDLEAVWNAATIGVPALKPELERLIASM